MARVLKSVPLKEKKVVCDNCGSTIAYVENDVKIKRFIERDGSGSGWEYVKCPAKKCGNDIILREW